MAWYKWGLVTSTSSGSGSSSISSQNSISNSEEGGDGGGSDYLFLNEKENSCSAINSLNLKSINKEGRDSNNTNNSAKNNSNNISFVNNNTAIINSNNNVSDHSDERDSCSSSISCNNIDSRQYRADSERGEEPLDGNQNSASYPTDTIDGNNNNTSRVNCNLIGRTAHCQQRLGRRLMRFQWGSGKVFQGKIKASFV